MKVLVTGGAGFIGSQLVRKLVEQNHEVTVIDDLSSGDIHNLDAVEKAIEFHLGTICDLSLVQRLTVKTDIIFHLATQCLVVGMDNPPHLHAVNDVGTFNVCYAAKENHCKVVYIGTSEEYGPQKIFPIREDAPFNPQSLYALTKILGEQYVKYFYRMYNVPAVIIRPFNTYGPLQREDLDMERLLKGFNAYAGVITSFIKRLETNQPPIIFGDGQQRRDFTYVTDIIDGFLLLSRLENCEIVNLGSGKDVSILELANLLVKLWGVDVDFTYAAPRPNDIRVLLADISLARTYGYEPKVSFQEGLQKYVEWYTSSRNRT